ncbi:MAG: poly-gamma-glutamate capsule biosynthesis protein CapA/YwtB (metallophosphatase superfamily) [Roseivirga sp.]|jgi:poly-gamma-glutamate capsule biosynthesis protein CapA/YwtB (metallophosphatase superfamily)
MRAIQIFILTGLIMSSITLNAQSLRIKAVGDIMLGSYTPRTVLPKGNGEIFAASIATYLDSADITFGNLEGVFVTDDIAPRKCSKESREAGRCYEFGMPENLAPALKDMHFSVLSMDNNHNSDYGEEGVTFTKKVLDKTGIAYAAKKAPIILNIKGKKVGVAAFGHSGVSYKVSDLAIAQQVINDLNEKCDLIIVSFHGGAEGRDAQHVQDTTETYYGENRGNLIRFAKTVIDAGADVVIGHGPHVLRGMDLYKDKLIVYSLGNFLTHGNVNIRDVMGKSAIMDIEIDLETGNLVDGTIIPTKQIDRGVAVYDSEGKAIELIKSLSEADFEESQLKINADGSFKKK